MQHWDKTGAVMKLSDVLCESGPESRQRREDGAQPPGHPAVGAWSSQCSDLRGRAMWSAQTEYRDVFLRKVKW